MSDNIPIDILDAANSAYMMQLEMGEEAVTAGEHKNIMVIEIAKAIYAERLRCAEICAAEREWGGNVEDAQDRIENGIEPRQIEGWNCPTSND